MIEQRELPAHEITDPESVAALSREWLVTNGLGGYASGTVSGALTRRYHGLLIAALPNPIGRMMMLNALVEQVHLPNRGVFRTGPLTLTGSTQGSSVSPTEFCLRAGVPVWTYQMDQYRLKKTVFLPYRRNLVYVLYELVAGSGPVGLTLLPAIHLRPHDAPVDQETVGQYVTQVDDAGRVTVTANTAGLPAVRLSCRPATPFAHDERRVPEVLYPIEQSRGYQWQGSIWSPGSFTCRLEAGMPVAFLATTEPWEELGEGGSERALEQEVERRQAVLESAAPACRDAMGGELVLAADQFIVDPIGREPVSGDASLPRNGQRTVIAGYHWFTDWGRDTMISLEGLTLVTGRYEEARRILDAFANHVRDGLIPNLFPEGQTEGLYHTADATLWYFHALARYVRYTGDHSIVRDVLPKLIDIAERHLAGTCFNIHVDHGDGLLSQGVDQLQLTWMDAKVGEFVVTPRRGKAVEINALWYNALCLLSGWLDDQGETGDARRFREWAIKAHQAFNERFWFAAEQRLYDVVDGESDQDTACRPNQIFALALDHPVLHQERWAAVVRNVQQELLTPLGLRSLSPKSPYYKRRYFGDLQSRDAAYHQGTVWPWLIGPFIDAWLRVHPDGKLQARQFLAAFPEHLNEAGIGSISEICDAETPHVPRGCISQAWSVAEVLRSWRNTAES